MKKIKIILVAFVIALTLASCTKPAEVVQENLEEKLSEMHSADDEIIKAVVEASKSKPDNSEYNNLIKSIFKNFKSNITSVEKVEDEVIATLEINTKETDALVTEFFEGIVSEITERSISNEPIEKEELFEKAIQKMTADYDKAPYKKDIDTITLTYEKNDQKEWVLNNDEEMYNVILGNIFEEINDYSENKLPEVFVNSFLDSMKNITTEEVSKLMGAEGSENPQYMLFAKYFNNIDFEVVDFEKTEEGSAFALKLQHIDTEKMYNEYIDSFANYLKEGLLAKKTPTEVEYAEKSFALLLESFENNLENKVSKETTLKVDNSLTIANTEEFLQALLSDLQTQSESSYEKLNERLVNLI